MYSPVLCISWDTHHIATVGASIAIKAIAATQVADAIPLPVRESRKAMTSQGIDAPPVKQSTAEDQYCMSPPKIVQAEQSCILAQ